MHIDKLQQVKDEIKAEIAESSDMRISAIESAVEDLKSSAVYQQNQTVAVQKESLPTFSNRLVVFRNKSLLFANNCNRNPTPRSKNLLVKLKLLLEKEILQARLSLKSPRT